MKKRKYKVGSPIPIWKEGMAQTLTFIVTEDCNLRCKYCYITHKSSGKKMNFVSFKKSKSSLAKVTFVVDELC